MSATLVREEGVHKLVYYVRRSLLDAETKYQKMEKLVLASRQGLSILSDLCADGISAEEHHGESSCYRAYIQVGQGAEGTSH